MKPPQSEVTMEETKQPTQGCSDSKEEEEEEEGEEEEEDPLIHMQTCRRKANHVPGRVD
jgi:hypothetical protein